MGKKGRRHVRSPAPRTIAGLEWAGGAMTLSVTVGDMEEPPQVWMWVEVPEGLVVGSRAVAPQDSRGVLGALLGESMTKPLVGPPRRPQRLRVPSEELAAELRAVAPPGTEIKVGAVPEIDDVATAFAEHLDAEASPKSYFVKGEVELPELRALFRGAHFFYSVAPWKVVHDGEPFRIDVPDLGVRGACAIVMGASDLTRGLVIYPSLEGFTSFLAAVDNLEEGAEPTSLGSETLALTFDRGSDLTEEMRREVLHHELPVFSADAFPALFHRTEDGVAVPLVRGEVELVTGALFAIAALVSRNQATLEEGEEPVSETHRTGDGPDVRITFPYEAYDWFDHEDAPTRPGRKVGRNDPCPCGSGKKFKKCHLNSEAPGSPVRHETVSPQSEKSRREHELVLSILQHARERFGEESQVGDLFRHTAGVDQLAFPWMAYHREVRGRRLVDWFREERGAELGDEQKEWIDRQTAAWLSLWKVGDITPGKGMKLHDLLSGTERVVRERTASKSLVRHDVVLARVVDYADSSEMWGMHPRRLPPMIADEVARRARRYAKRQRVPVERLRGDAFGRYLITRWEEALAELELRFSQPPALVNTDGDPLEPTTDRYRISIGAAAEVARRLGEESVADEVSRTGKGRIPITRAEGDNETVVGFACIDGHELVIESNSSKRADRLRSWAEKRCGANICHLERDRGDLERWMQRLPPEAAPETGAEAEADQILREFKLRHYIDWLDTALPAFNGKTPREMAQSREGRKQVAVLLDDMENLELRRFPDAPFDFDILRRKLGL